MVWYTHQKMLKASTFQVGGNFIRKVLEFIESWSGYYKHHFKWNYTGEGLHDKTISRFNKQIYSLFLMTL
jgi:hypothetical protein